MKNVVTVQTWERLPNVYREEGRELQVIKKWSERAHECDGFEPPTRLNNLLEQVVNVVVD